MARRLQFWQSASVLLLLVAGIVLSVVLFRPAQALTEEQPGRFSRLHIVGKGEDLASIASHGEYPVHLLKELNGLAPEHELWVGQPLQLPSPEPSGETLASVNQYHRVLLGETLHQIANYYGLHPIELAHINRLSPNDLLYTGQLIRVPNAVVWTRLQETGYMSQFDSYEMQEADTLESVAEHFEVSAKSIRSFNALQPTDSPLPGTDLAIPSRPVVPQFDVNPTSSANLGQIVRVKEKWLKVDLGTLQITAFEGMTPVRRLTILNRGHQDTTARGMFRIWAKTTQQDMSRNLPAGFDLSHVGSVPWVQYFYQDFAIHGSFWDVSPEMRSGTGNVVLAEEEAGWLFQWTTPNPSGGVDSGDGWVVSLEPGAGTLVFVHD